MFWLVAIGKSSNVLNAGRFHSSFKLMHKMFSLFFISTLVLFSNTSFGAPQCETLFQQQQIVNSQVLRQWSALSEGDQLRKIESLANFFKYAPPNRDLSFRNRFSVFVGYFMYLMPADYSTEIFADGWPEQYSSIWLKSLIIELQKNTFNDEAYLSLTDLIDSYLTD